MLWLGWYWDNHTGLENSSYWWHTKSWGENYTDKLRLFKCGVSWNWIQVIWTSSHVNRSLVCKIQVVNLPCSRSCFSVFSEQSCRSLGFFSIHSYTCRRLIKCVSVQGYVNALVLWLAQLFTENFPVLWYSMQAAYVSFTWCHSIWDLLLHLPAIF